MITQSNIHDLDIAMQLEGVVDVTQWGLAHVHFIPNGTPPSSAVVEAVQSHDPAGLHRESLPSPITLVLDSSEITPIDVSDIAFLAFDVTTAEASRQGRIVVSLSEPMFGEYQEIMIDVGAVGPCDPIITDKPRVFVHAQPKNKNTTAAIEIKQALISQHPVSFPTPAIPAIGSGVVSINKYPGFSLPVVCTAAQANQIIALYVYSRELNHHDTRIDAGTEFPPNPYDGQGHTRTDLDGERFHWDATRSKWLGELRSMFAARNYTGSGSGGGLTLAFDGVLLDDNTGFGIDHDFTIVGAEFTSKQSVSIDLDWHHAGTKQTTLMTMSSEARKSVYTLNYDETSSMSNNYRFELSNRTAGTIDDPVVKIWYRKKAT